jgi:hypothetical protein
MNTPQPIRSGELAEHLATIQPPAIASRIFDNPQFRSRFGIEIKRAISYGGGPAISKRTLHDWVRNLFADQQLQTISALDGQEIRLSLGDGHILISSTADDGTTIEVGSVILMLLSPDRETRQGAFNRLLAEVGPTGPADAAYWRRELDKGPLDDESMEALTDQFGDSSAPHLGRIRRDIATGVLDKRNLVPNSPTYWQRLCGPLPNHVDQETWLAQVFEPHRRGLIDRELARGLDLCLAMNLRDDLSPSRLTAHISNDELWAALQQIQPFEDPFSLLGVVDLASGRAATDQRFAELSAQAVERLSGETLCRQDGLDVYDFLPALFELALSELQVMPIIALQPAFWRQICAWTQAALLARAFQLVTFDPTVFCENLRQLHYREAATAALLDLQELPLWHPSASGRILLRAVVVGRLVILRDRDAAQGRELPSLAALNKAVEQISEAAPHLINMPGPLEANRLPLLRMEDRSSEEVTQLRHRADELTADTYDQNWVVLSHLSRLIQFDDYVLSRMTAVVPTIDFSSNRDDDAKIDILRIAVIAFIAVAQRNLPLSEAILTRCHQEIQECSDDAQADALIKAGFIAVAASADRTVALDRLGRYLLDLSYLLPPGGQLIASTDPLGMLRKAHPKASLVRLRATRCRSNSPGDRGNEAWGILRQRRRSA